MRGSVEERVGKGKRDEEGEMSVKKKITIIIIPLHRHAKSALMTSAHATMSTGQFCGNFIFSESQAVLT